MKQQIITRLLQGMLGIILFLLPVQTIWIVQERFLNGAKWEYGTIAYYGTEALLWTAVVLFIFWYVKSQKLQGKHITFSWTKDRVFLAACLAIILYGFASILWAPEKQIAFQQAFRMLEASLLFFMLFVGPLSFHRATFFFVSGATLQSMFGIWQFLTQSTVASSWFGLASHPAYQAGTSIVAGEGIGRWLRAYGGFSHPNVFGGYLAISICLTVFVLLEKQVQKQSIRLFLEAALLLQSAALFFTFSRSAWIAAAFVLAYVGYSAIRKKRIRRVFVFLPSMFLIGILSIVYAPVLETRIAGASYHEEQSGAQRISGYQEALALFQRHPYFGVGVGNYTYAAYALEPHRPGWEYQPVHNVPLLILVELGLLGVGLICVVTYTFFRWQKAMQPFFAVVVFSPVILLDHYLFSSYAGLVMSAALFGLVVRLNFFQKNE